MSQDKGWFAMGIRTNNGGDIWNSGLSVILGSPATNYEDVSVAGIRHLNQGDFLSMWVFASQDKNWMADGSQGGLSVARLDTTIAVSLASNCSRGHKNTRYVRKVGWTELGNCDDGYGGWRTDSYKSLLKSEHFDHKSGRFTAPHDGMYFASAMVRLDNAATGIIALAILTNGVKSMSSGISVADSALASNYDSLVATGMRGLDAGDYLSVFIYSDEDKSFHVATDRSGFHVAQLSRELPSPDGADDDVKTSDGVVWQEVFGHPKDHDQNDEGWEHVGAAGTWGTCKADRGSRI